MSPAKHIPRPDSARLEAWQVFKLGLAKSIHHALLVFIAIGCGRERPSPGAGNEPRGLGIPLKETKSGMVPFEGSFPHFLPRTGKLWTFHCGVSGVRSVKFSCVLCELVSYFVL